MAYDAGMLSAVLSEVRHACLLGRIEKVYQPSGDEIDLLIHGEKGNCRLCIQVGSNAPRLSLSAVVKENPATAPMFCMLMRKHLNGARLISVEQAGFERVAELHFLSRDEMGFEVERILVAEIMGKYSNLMLLDGNRKIIAALKQVDFSTSRLRQVLPGMIYELPPKQDKTDPFSVGEGAFMQLLQEASADMKLSQFLTSRFLGLATITAREIAFRIAGDTDASLLRLDFSRAYSVFASFFADLCEERFQPTLLLDSEDNPKEYTFFEVTHSTGYQKRVCASFAELLDSFYVERERIERIRARAADLFHLLSNAENRLLRKLELQRSELAEAEKGEDFRRMGDLITANLYRLKWGDKSFMAIDYTLDPPSEVAVTLDTRLSPSSNAQRFYKKYTKAKHAVEYLTREILSAEEELVYLEGVRVFLERAETESDLQELRDELYRSGYASRMKSYAPQKESKLTPMSFKTSSGYILLCGRNNLQNDRLTFKTASKGDLWFHAKGVPGSHVILLCDGEEPSEEDYTEAAELAAYYSKASKGTLVPVDYTRVKQVKKPAGAKPGYVIYHTNYTAYVQPRVRVTKTSK